MSKLQKINQPTDYFSISEWERVWRSDDFQKYEGDFLQILKEYKEIRERYVSAIDSRWRWLEKKGVIKIELLKDFDGKDYLNMYGATDRFPEYAAMFSKFIDWLSFREKRGIYIWSEEVARAGVLDMKNAAANLAKNMTLPTGDITPDDILEKW